MTAISSSSTPLLRKLSTRESVSSSSSSLHQLPAKRGLLAAQVDERHGAPRSRGVPRAIGARRVHREPAVAERVGQRDDLRLAPKMVRQLSAFFDGHDPRAIGSKSSRLRARDRATVAPPASPVGTSVAAALHRRRSTRSRDSTDARRRSRAQLRLSAAPTPREPGGIALPRRSPNAQCRQNQPESSCRAIAASSPRSRTAGTVCALHRARCGRAARSGLLLDDAHGSR